MKIRIILFIFLMVLLTSSALAISTANLAYYYGLDSNTGLVSSDLPGGWTGNIYGSIGQTVGMRVNNSLNWSSRNGANYIKTNRTDSRWSDMTATGRNYAYSFWAFLPNYAGCSDVCIVFQKSNAAGNQEVWLGFLPSGKITYYVYQNGKRSNDPQNVQLNTGTLNNQWHFYVMRFNGTSNVGEFFVDGVSIQNTSFSFPDTQAEVGDFYIGRNPNPGAAFAMLGNIDELAIWNATLTNNDIQQLYNNGTGYNPFNVTTPYAQINFVSPTPDTGAFQHITAQNYINVKSNVTNAAIGNITNYLYNSSGLVTSATCAGIADCSTNFTSLSTGVYYINASLIINGVVNASAATRNVTIYDATISFATPTSGQNVDENLTIAYTPTFTPAGLSMTSYKLDLLNNDNTLNRTLVTTPNATYAWNLFSMNISVGAYTLNVTGTDSQSTNHTFTSSSFNVVADATLNITLKNALNSSVLTNASINVTDLVTGSKTTYTTTNGNIKAYIVKGHNLTIDVDPVGYAITQANYTANTSQAQYLNVSVYTENSVYVNVFDEANGLRITGTNISIVFTGTVEEVFSTTTGIYYADALLDGAYTVKLSGGNYSLKTYSITVNNRSTQTLNAYLNSNVLTTIFQVTDRDTGANVYDASFLMERLINTSYVVVDSKNTDITGRVQVSYLPNVKYRFTIAKTGYTSQVFYLDPIIFSTYTVRLVSTGGAATSQDYNDVSIIYYPRTFWNGRQNNFTFTVSSPSGVLEAYSINLTYPGGSVADSGVNAVGETFNLNFTLGNVSFYDKVNVTYTYTSTLGGLRIFRASYEILGANVSSNTSIVSIKERDYGLGWFEKVMITTLIAIVFAGFVYGMAGAGGAVFAALIIFGVAAFLGFMPWWSVLITILVGFAIISADAKAGGA